MNELAQPAKELHMIRIPAARIIGRETRNGGKLGNTAPALWDAVYAGQDHVVLEALPKAGHQELFGWTCEYDPATKTFVYLVCALTPAGTPVPEGFAYREIPTTLCAVGLYGESVNKTLKRAAEQGYVANWSADGCGWNAEMYFSAEEANPPKQTKSPWHWLVPVRAAE